MKPLRRSKPLLSQETYNLVPKIVRPAVRLLKSAGVNDETIYQAVAKACRQHAKERVRGVEVAFERFLQLTDIVMNWARDPEFIDQYGAPKKLNLCSEEPSFQRLIEKAGVPVPLCEAVEQLRELHSVRLCDRNRKVRLLSHVLLSVRPRYFVIAPVLDEMRRFLETIEHNVCANPSALEGRMQRTVMCTSMDPAQFPEAQRFVRQNAQSFLDALDEKLNSCQSRKQNGHFGYGAGIYVFVDRSSTQKRAARRRRA
jgi:hypothetical protein